MPERHRPHRRTLAGRLNPARPLAGALGLLLAASGGAWAQGIDGEAALRHAAALAALGPHPFGSPRAQAAAEYVTQQFRAAGLEEVRSEPFERLGLRGANVVGVLRAGGPDFLVVGAHHDTVPEAPGAYDAGGGVGVVIETARVLAQRPARARTLVFVTWDGEEAGWTRRGTTAGSRAYLERLGPQAQQLSAALVVEMCGWRGGRPVAHAVPYRDPLRPREQVQSPAWLVRAALEGARRAGRPMSVGDPLLSWLYQPAARIFRVGFYGDDLSFLQAGRPALFFSDSSLTRFYPWYHTAEDTRDKLDPQALAEMGTLLLAMIETVSATRPGPAQEPVWFAAFGTVWGAPVVYGLLALSLLPGLLTAVGRGGTLLGVRLAQALGCAALAWKHPVPALALLALPNLLTAFSTRAWTFLALLPTLAVAVFGATAWRRGLVSGLWLAPWELALLGLALALLWLSPGAQRVRGGPARGTRARSSASSRRGRG